MGFEWDESKREANINKHGVDFVRAAKIFANPVIERLDDREVYNEERLIATGHWEGYFIVVVYWRGQNRRIISAWKAGKDEQKEYFKAVHR